MEFLKRIEKSDTYGFLKNIDNWCNHRILLYLALELTKNNKYPVSEYGAGIGSSDFLRNYCFEKNREFLTYDSNKGWANKCNSVFIEDWGTSYVFDREYSVAFIDLAPGYYRKRALELLKGKAEIIVVHDTELFGAGDYQIEPGLQKFNYRINYNIRQGGAGVTAVSDTVDLSVFDGLFLNEYLLEA